MVINLKKMKNYGVDTKGVNVAIEKMKQRLLAKKVKLIRFDQ